MPILRNSSAILVDARHAPLIKDAPAEPDPGTETRARESTPC